MLVKLIKIGFLTAAFLIFYPGMPLVGQVFTPPVAPRPQPVLPPPGVMHLQQVEDLVFALTNQARQAKGLAPLVKDEELRRMARAYSDDMLVRRFFGHTTPEGVSLEERLTKHYPHRVTAMAENIWSGFGYNPNQFKQVAQEIINFWMNSPGHRANLLSPHYTHLGVGVSARQQTILATQVFVCR